jgi:hypothetical protein
MTDQLVQDALDAPGYVDFLDQEYLASYVGYGGAAVKLLVTEDEFSAESLAKGLDVVGDGFQHVAVSAVTTRIHLIDQIFAEVARQLDWIGLAQAVVRSAFDLAGFPPADPADLSVSTVARHHEVDSAELYRSVRRSVEQIECETVIGWLRGDRVPAGELRKLSLQAKVSRYNARSLLLSLTRWLRLAGHSGLVLRLDLSRLAVSRRPPAGLRDGHYYSKAAVLDAYELLRQLIDGTDEFEGLFVAVLLPPELVHDEARGLPAYTALRLRVVDEVRDRSRINPFSTLVRIGSDREATE